MLGVKPAIYVAPAHDLLFTTTAAANDSYRSHWYCNFGHQNL